MSFRNANDESNKKILQFWITYLNKTISLLLFKFDPGIKRQGSIPPAWPVKMADIK